MDMTTRSYKKSQSIKTLLLDTAERLFAEKGLYGVSVRDITGAADVRNASINYHFGSKGELYAAVLKRRLAPLSKARLERLGRLAASGGDRDLTLRALVQAFALPILEFAASPDKGWRHYCILVARSSVQPHVDSHMVSKGYDETALRFLHAIAEICPDAGPYRVQCAYQFMLGTTLYAVCDNKRIDALSAGQYRSDDLASLTDPFIDYVTGGLVAMLGGPESQAKPEAAKDPQTAAG